MNEEEIAEEINKQFHDGVRKWMADENSKRDMSYFHVSSFVYKCKRKVWYEAKYSDKVPPLDDASISRMWIGTKLHETPVSDLHEVPVWYEFDGVKLGGRIDEIMKVDGKTFIIDKKFVNYIPRTPNDHYIEQVKFYAALYRLNTGTLVDGIGIHYYKPTVSYKDEDQKMREKTFVRFVDEEEILKFEKYIEEMLKDIDYSLKNDVLPEPMASWYCEHCPFMASCLVNKKEFIARSDGK